MCWLVQSVTLYFFIAYLNLADALLGFLIISFVLGFRGFGEMVRYIPSFWFCWKFCFTIRSSPLWKLIIPMRPPGVRHDGAC